MNTNMNTKEKQIYHIFQEETYKRFEASPKLASITELVSIIIGNSQARPALAIAEEVATAYMGDESTRTRLDDINFRDLLSIPGITKDKAVKICAAIELGRRLTNFHKRNLADFSNPQKVANYFMEKLRHETQEHFIACYTNAKLKMIGYKTIGIGNLTLATVDMKEIMKWAIRYKAYGIILVHNHPSGNPEPSETDKATTMTIAAAAKLMDTHVIDHIIIGDGIYTSLNERKEMEQ